jgi:hypothetical protein
MGEKRENEREGTRMGEKRENEREGARMGEKRENERGRISMGQGRRLTLPSSTEATRELSTSSTPFRVGRGESGGSEGVRMGGWESEGEGASFVLPPSFVHLNDPSVTWPAMLVSWPAVLTCPLELVCRVDRDGPVIGGEHMIHELNDADLAVLDDLGVQLDQVVLCGTRSCACECVRVCAPQMVLNL